MRVLKSFLLAILAFALVCNVVLAAWGYLFPINIVDTSNTTRAYYPVMLGFGGQTLVDAEKILASGNDTNLQIGSQSIKYMMSTTNVVAVLPSLPSGGVVTTSLYTGYSPSQSGFPIITGSGGYVTVADNDTLELGNNFTVSMSGYVDTTTGADKNLCYKPIAYRTYISDTGNITSVIISGATSNETLRPDGAGDETNLTPSAGANWQCVSDANDATYVSTSNDTYVRDLYTLNNSANTHPIVSVTIYFRIMSLNFGGPLAHAIPHFKIGASVYDGAEQTDGTSGWVTKNQTYPTSPATSSAWTWAEINAMQIGISLKQSGATTARCADEWIVVIYYPETVLASATATGVSSDEHTVATSANTTHLSIAIDGVTVNSTALGGGVVPDNSNNWTWMQNNVMPYCDNITLSVNGTPQLYLAPLVMLTGVTIPDRAGGNNPGTIHWGSNSGITITYGEMSSYESYVATSNETAGFDVPTAPMPETWFAGGENVSSLPFYDSFFKVSSQEGMPPIQAFYFWGIIGVAFGAFLGIVTFTHSALIAYIAMVIVFGVGASMTIIPAWIVFVMIVVGVGIMYLYKQVAY